MKEFLKILRRFVPPYKKYLFLNIFFNLLTAFLTLFSFAIIIPILEMLFKIFERCFLRLESSAIEITFFKFKAFFSFHDCIISIFTFPGN